MKRDQSVVGEPDAGRLTLSKRIAAMGGFVAPVGVCFNAIWCVAQFACNVVPFLQQEVMRKKSGAGEGCLFLRHGRSNGAVV
jgi:hypothetical protein